MENDREIIYDIKEKNGKTKEELEELLSYWQKKLKMNDWKLDLKIVDFKRKDYRQSGDFVADPEKKTASILITWNPWRGDEEHTLVHEMIHVLFYNYDKYSEELILNKYKKNGLEHDMYLEKLEDTVHHLTQIILSRSDR